MIYLYFCIACDKTLDILKSANEHRRVEYCPSCNSTLERVFTAPQISGAKNEWPEFNPAFGKVIRNKNHRREEARKNDWIEVGTENPNKIANDFAKQREDKWQRSWNEV